MKSEQVLAIVLRAVRFEERHKIVTALTAEHGIVTAMAKNSVHSKRFGGTLDIFALAEWSVQIKPTSEVWLLNEAIAKESFNGIRSDFCKMALGSMLNEILLKTGSHNTQSQDLLKLHYHALLALENAAAATGAGETDFRILNTYIVKILQWAGAQPQIHGCVQCQTALSEVAADSELTFVVESAAWLCPQCRRESTAHLTQSSQIDFQSRLKRVRPEVLYQMAVMMTQPMKKVLEILPFATERDRRVQKELYPVANGLLMFHVPGFDRMEQQPLKSARFLDLAP